MTHELQSAIAHILSAKASDYEDKLTCEEIIDRANKRTGWLLSRKHHSVN